MDNIQEGIIIETNGVFAKINVTANCDCDNCGACGTSKISVLAYNPLEARLGQKIRFIVYQNNMLKISFVLFIFPLLSIFAGIFIGITISGFFNLNQTLITAVSGILLFSLSVLLIIFYDRKSKNNVKNFPRIVEIIS